MVFIGRVVVLVVIAFNIFIYFYHSCFYTYALILKYIFLFFLLCSLHFKYIPLLFIHSTSILLLIQTDATQKCILGCYFIESTEISRLNVNITRTNWSGMESIKVFEVYALFFYYKFRHQYLCFCHVISQCSFSVHSLYLPCAIHLAINRRHGMGF